MDAINEHTNAQHQEFEYTTQEIIERLTKIIEDTGVPPETAGRTFKIFPDKVEGYFKISANNDPSKKKTEHVNYIDTT
jgi:hypothetical protein